MKIVSPILALSSTIAGYISTKMCFIGCFVCGKTNIPEDTKYTILGFKKTDLLIYGANFLNKYTYKGFKFLFSLFIHGLVFMKPFPVIVFLKNGEKCYRFFEHNSRIIKITTNIILSCLSLILNVSLLCLKNVHYYSS